MGVGGGWGWKELKDAGAVGGEGLREDGVPVPMRSRLGVLEGGHTG